MKILEPYGHINHDANHCVYILYETLRLLDDSTIGLYNLKSLLYNVELDDRCRVTDTIGTRHKGSEYLSFAIHVTTQEAIRQKTAAFMILTDAAGSHFIPTFEDDILKDMSPETRVLATSNLGYSVKMSVYTYFTRGQTFYELYNFRPYFKNRYARTLQDVHKQIYRLIEEGKNQRHLFNEGTRRDFDNPGFILYSQYPSIFETVQNFFAAFRNFQESYPTPKTLCLDDGAPNYLKIIFDFICITCRNKLKEFRDKTIGTEEYLQFLAECSDLVENLAGIMRGCGVFPAEYAIRLV